LIAISTVLSLIFRFVLDNILSILQITVFINSALFSSAIFSIAAVISFLFLSDSTSFALYHFRKLSIAVNSLVLISSNFFKSSSCIFVDISLKKSSLIVLISVSKSFISPLAHLALSCFFISATFA